MTPSPALSVEDGLLPAYVYLLRSRRDGKYYTGWTTDISRRMTEHNEGQTISTQYRRPLDLMGYETYSSVALAKSREHALKHNPLMLRYFKKRVLHQTALRAEGR